MLSSHNGLMFYEKLKGFPQYQFLFFVANLLFLSCVLSVTVSSLGRIVSVLSISVV